MPVAVGLALADKMQGRTRVTCCFFGEGAVAEGEFHESLNLAALWQLPVLFVCENNLYAMGTALARSESQTDLCTKAAGYGIHAEAVDGMDVLETEDAAAPCGCVRTRWAAARRFSNSARTASARIRCSTPSCIATKRKSKNGRSAAR